MNEIIDKNPLDRVKNLPIRIREPEPFTGRNSQNPACTDGQQRNLIQFDFWSELLTSELIALRWQDIDFENDRIFVRQAKVRGHIKGTKTSAGSREVILQPQAKEAILNQHAYTRKFDKIVFHNSQTGNPWENDQAIRKIV